MSEVLYIKKCLRQIEQKVNRGSSDEWTREDFKRIQGFIFEASSINLSTHTLKRLYGKIQTRKYYQPQADTKNALAMFLGYSDWYDFENHNPITPENPDVVNEPAVADLKQPSTSAERGVKKNNSTTIVLALMAISVISAAIAFAVFKPKSTATEVIFKVENPLGPAPHTLKFVHDLSSLEGKKNLIVFPEFKRDTIKLSKDQKFSYWPLINPGWNTAYLLSDQKVVAKTMFFTQTEGWKVDVTKHPDRESSRFAIKAEVSSGGRLYNPRTSLPEHEINYLLNTFNYYFLSYYNIRNFGVDGDNATFETRFRNNSQEVGALCYDMWFKLLGTRGVLKMHFLSTGCTGFLRMTFGELNISGDNKQNLPQFGIDIQKWKKARLQVIDKTVHIYLEDSLIYKTKYTQSVGSIMGLEVISKTNGQTDYVKLYNAKKKLVYQDDFGGKAVD
jgi:hypothetical protein